MDLRKLRTQPLSFWDVPAALVGFVVSMVVLLGGVVAASAHPVIHHLAFAVALVGVLPLGPLTLVAARRKLLPQLTPDPGRTRPPLTLGRRMAAYSLLVLGGLVGGLAGAIAATMCYLAVKDGDMSWGPFLAVDAVAVFGALLFAVGVRWLT